MTPQESTQVAVELAEMRGEIRTGFAELGGQLNLALQRADQTDEKLKDHETRLDALERARWPLPSLAAATGLGSLAVALYALVAR